MSSATWFFLFKGLAAALILSVLLPWIGVLRYINRPKKRLELLKVLFIYKEEIGAGKLAEQKEKKYKHLKQWIRSNFSVPAWWLGLVFVRHFEQKIELMFESYKLLANYDPGKFPGRWRAMSSAAVMFLLSKTALLFFLGLTLISLLIFLIDVLFY